MNNALRSFGLPIDAVLPDIRATLAAHPSLVLEAPPGAGKTTAVPLALLDEPWLQQRKILMLEPRRIAARAAARRMASLLGEAVGQTVGYAMRMDRKIGPNTRIEVVTEGILVRRLQNDPELSDVALVIFDEFHERSLDADLGLALTLEARAALRDDLKVLVMSATLDGVAVASLLDNAPIVRSAGQSYPVTTRYLERSADSDIVAETVRMTRHVLREESGSVLVFLPGVGEIRRVAEALKTNVPSDVILAPLYGDLSPADQDQAIRPAADGKRKIVLATSIAETSLTIDGVTIVIDSGRARSPVFDPTSGMSRLETIKVTASAAAQRRGRAGRTAPGVCYRLWTEAEDRALIPFPQPEIAAADLAPLALELAVWGVQDATTLQWLTAPPSAALAQARTLLISLGALDADGIITPHGRAMAARPLHPRLAHMLILARAQNQESLAAVIATLISERDPFRGEAARSDRDLRSRIEAIVKGRSPHSDSSSLKRLLESARKLTTSPWVMPDHSAILDHTGPLLAFAYPDRIARRRDNGRGVYQLANGRGATIDAIDPLAQEDYLTVAALDGDKAAARIFLAAPLDHSDLDRLFSNQITQHTLVAWDDRSRAVQAVVQRKLNALVLSEKPAAMTEDQLIQAVAAGIRSLGLNALPWDHDTNSLRTRVIFAQTHDPDGQWPDWSDQALLDNLEQWLGPYLNGANRESQFNRIKLHDALLAQLPWSQQQHLDRFAPSHLVVPSGSRLPLAYEENGVVLAVRLQEMFGATVTPTVMDGRMAVTLHLLSPAHRPVQVTQDLIGFWDRSYVDVKRDLKGRYPKHAWPDDPRTAPPTARAKPRQR